MRPRSPREGRIRATAVAALVGLVGVLAGCEDTSPADAAGAGSTGVGLAGDIGDAPDAEPLDVGPQASGADVSSDAEAQVVDGGTLADGLDASVPSEETSTGDDVTPGDLAGSSDATQEADTLEDVGSWHDGMACSDAQPVLASDDLASGDAPSDDVPSGQPAGPVEDACTNPSDQAAIDLITPESYSEGFQGCGGGCFAVQSCIAPCLEDTFGVSADCAGCWAHAIACTLAYCLGECQSGDGCQWCALQNGCWSDFSTCAGMPPLKFE